MVQRCIPWTVELLDFGVRQANAVTPSTYRGPQERQAIAEEKQAKELEKIRRLLERKFR